MDDEVIIKYGNKQIAELNEDGTKVLKTTDTFCEKDISIIYKRINEYDGKIKIIDSEILPYNPQDNYEGRVKVIKSKILPYNPQGEML